MSRLLLSLVLALGALAPLPAWAQHVTALARAEGAALLSALLPGEGRVIHRQFLAAQHR